MAFKDRNYNIKNLPTFRLGLNTQQSPDEIKDEELTNMENFSVEEDSLSTAPGYSTWDNGSIEAIDSYSEANQGAAYTIYLNNYRAQSFTGVYGTISKVQFYLKKQGSPTGMATAKIYAHTGTFGTTSKPTGEALAVSSEFDVSTLTTSYALTDFGFSDELTFEAGVNYTVSIEFAGGDGSNYLWVGIDTSAPTHGGNSAYFNGSVWTAIATSDLCFYVHATVPHYGPYWGGVCFKKADGTVVDVRQRQDALEWSDTSETWSPCTLPTTGSPASTVSLAQRRCTFAALNDILLWTNGTDTVMSSTDGQTWTLQPSLPICRVIFENAKNRVLFLAQKDSPFRFDWSAINDPLTIGASSNQLIDPNNHGIILGAGLTPEGTTLVFKESGVYSVADFVDDGIIDINFIGATKLSSHATIATTQDSVIWYSWDGISEYIGGQIRGISGRLGLGGAVGLSSDMDVLKGELFCGAFYNNKYHVCMPNANISTDYNSLELIVYKNLLRGDALQPYAITRNKRYFGMYFIEDAEYEYGRDITLYGGDSRSQDLLAAGENPIFAWVNDYRDYFFVGFPVELGLAGERQPAFFETKFFTENVPFYVKKYKKLFANCKFTDTADIMIGYRFDPFSSYTMVSAPVETTDIDWTYDDGSTGGFSEGFGFSQESIANLFLDIENTEKPRGIQFKVTTNEINDITNFGMAYKFSVKSGKFK